MAFGRRGRRLVAAAAVGAPRALGGSAGDRARRRRRDALAWSSCRYLTSGVRARALTAPTRGEGSTGADKWIPAAEVERSKGSSGRSRPAGFVVRRTSRASESGVVASPNEGGGEDGDDGLADDSDGDHSAA